MVIKITTTPILKVLSSDRFESRYHLIYNTFEEFEKKSKLEIVNFGDPRLLKKITDGEHAGQTFVDKGVRFIKNSAVRDFNIDLLDEFYISEEKHKQQKRSALKPLDILFTTIGHLGSSAIVPEDFGEANINQNVVKIEINSEFIDPYFLTVYLNSNITKKQISALFTGNIHSIITYPKIRSIRILIPEKHFQKEISQKYRLAIDNGKKAFELITQARLVFYDKIDVDFSKIKKEKVFSKNLMEFDPGGLWTPKYSYPLYVQTIQEIKHKWDTMPLGQIAIVKKGDEVGSDNYIEYLDKKESDVPFIRTSDIVNYEADHYPDFFIPEQTFTELKQDLKKSG